MSNRQSAMSVTFNIHYDPSVLKSHHVQLYQSTAYYFYCYLVQWFILYRSIIYLQYRSARKTRTTKINIAWSVYNYDQKIMVGNYMALCYSHSDFWSMDVVSFRIAATVAFD